MLKKKIIILLLISCFLFITSTVYAEADEDDINNKINQIKKSIKKIASDSITKVSQLQNDSHFTTIDDSANFAVKTYSNTFTQSNIFSATTNNFKNISVETFTIGTQDLTQRFTMNVSSIADMYLKTSGSSNYSLFEFDAGSNNTVQMLLRGGSSTGSTWGIPNAGLFKLTSSGASSKSMLIGTGGNYPLIFGTGGNEAVRIDSSGRVGIGTIVPNYNLQVVGNIKADTFYGNGSGLTNITAGIPDTVLTQNNFSDSIILIRTKTGGAGDTGLPALTFNQYNTYPLSRKLEPGNGLIADTSISGKFILQVNTNLFNEYNKKYQVYTFTFSDTLKFPGDTKVITITDTQFNSNTQYGAYILIKDDSEYWQSNNWRVSISGYSKDTMSFVLTAFDTISFDSVRIFVYSGVYNTYLIFNDSNINAGDTFIFKIDNLLYSICRQWIYLDTRAADTGYVCDNSNSSIKFDYSNNKIIVKNETADSIAKNELMLQIAVLIPADAAHIYNSIIMTYGSYIKSIDDLYWFDAWTAFDTGVLSDTRIYNYSQDLNAIEAVLHISGLTGKTIDFFWADSFNAVSAGKLDIRKFK